MIEKIFIFGAHGMLGRYVYTYLKSTTIYEVIPITKNEFNISTNMASLEEFLISKNINDKTCIINCIGLIPQRVSSNNNINTYEYFLINSIFPQLLCKYSNKYLCKMIQPTTDCVFSGLKGNYVESDFHDEKGVYGISKSLGENVNCTIIRTSIIGEELDNKYSFLEWVKNSKGNIYGYNNHLWNGITCLEYAKIIRIIIKYNLFWNGVRHIYSPEVKSKYDLCCIIKKVYDLHIDIIKKEEEGEMVDKTLNSIHPLNFDIQSLEKQIFELKNFLI
jgi:dTDP-4-dehydrorhamnose reductase